MKLLPANFYNERKCNFNLLNSLMTLQKSHNLLMTINDSLGLANMQKQSLKHTEDPSSPLQTFHTEGYRFRHVTYILCDKKAQNWKRELFPSFSRGLSSCQISDKTSNLLPISMFSYFSHEKF